MIFWIFLSIAFLLLLLILFVPKKDENIIVYQAPLGAGKTLLTNRLALKLYKKNLRKVLRENRRRLIYAKIKHLNYELLPLPDFITNLPTYFSKYNFAKKFNVQDFLSKKYNPLSVIFLDEVGSLPSFSQNDYKNFSEMYDSAIRYYRQDTKGGYLIMNDQSFYNIVVGIRRRVNVVYSIDEIKKNRFFAFIKVSVFDNISDELRPRLDKKGKPVRLIKFVFFKKGEYDTYAHYEIYNKRQNAEMQEYIKSRNNSYVDDSCLLSLDAKQDKKRKS